MSASQKLIWTEHADLAINRRPTVDRREFLDYMTFTSNQRPLFTEIFGPIIGLKERWLAQGASQAELDFSAFEFRCEQRSGLHINTGWHGGQQALLEENDEYRIVRDAKGRTVKLPKGYATLGLPLDFPVRNMDDWLAVKHHYQFCEERLAEDWYEHGVDCLNLGHVISVNIPGGYDELRSLMGDERACLAFYDQPELVQDLLDTISQTFLKVFRRVADRIQIDLLCVHEDFAGKSGPLVGPEQIREFIGPYYRKAWHYLSGRGVRLFDLDSDGDINPIISPLLDAGLNCMHPFEPAAGMDIVQAREQYGQRLAMYGGLDKFVLSRTREDIVRELEYKIPPMIRTGGCVIGLDHRIPETTPLENYRFYIQKAWEIIDRETA